MPSKTTPTSRGFLKRSAVISTRTATFRFGRMELLMRARPAFRRTQAEIVPLYREAVKQHHFLAGGQSTLAIRIPFPARHFPPDAPRKFRSRIAISFNFSETGFSHRLQVSGELPCRV